MDAVAAVDEAFTAVPRRDYLREGYQDEAGYDEPLPIGHGQTNSQPSTVRDMLVLLEVQPGQRVLDVGAGSGWTTALLGHLVGPTGLVVGVEIEPDLASWGEANVPRTPYAWASVRPAEPDVLGVPAEGPYDRILVSAAARSLPEQLVGQLADGGRMVIPVNGVMVVAVKSGDRVRLSEHGYYRFVPLH